MYGQRARERNVIATRRGGERERGVSSGKDGLYAMHKTEQGFATYKGKSVIVSTMIYDPSSKVVQIFVHRGVHLLEKLVRGVHRLGGNFHSRVTSIIFSMARAYIISSPPPSLDNYLDALFIVLLSYRFNWHIGQFYYCSHHAVLIIK